LLVSGAQLAVAAGHGALLPEDVLGRGLVVVLGRVRLIVDLGVFEFAGAVGLEFVGRVAEFAGAELTVLCAVVAVVGVLGHLALGFLVVRHVVLKVGFAVDLDHLEGRLRVEGPALLELARVAPVAAPGVLHDPEAYAVLVLAPAEALDGVAAGRVALVRGRLVDARADAVHLRLDGHADDHGAELHQVGLDLGGGGKRGDLGLLAAAAHLVRLEVVVVLEPTPVQLLVVDRAAVAVRVGGAVVGVGAGAVIAPSGDLVVDVALTLACDRTAAVVERVGAAAVALGVAALGAEARFRHLAQRLRHDAAVAPLPGLGCRRAVEQVFFGKVGLLVATVLAVRFGVLDCIRVRDCVGHRETPARAALALVHDRREAAVLLLAQVEELRQRWVWRLVGYGHRLHVVMLSTVTKIVFLLI